MKRPHVIRRHSQVSGIRTNTSGVQRFGNSRNGATKARIHNSWTAIQRGQVGDSVSEGYEGCVSWLVNNPLLKYGALRSTAGQRPDSRQRLWRARRSEDAATATLGWNLPQTMAESVKEARRGNRNGWAGRGSTTRPPCPRYGERQRSIRSPIAESLACHQLRQRHSASSRNMPHSVLHISRTTKSSVARIVYLFRWEFCLPRLSAL